MSDTRTGSTSQKKGVGAAQTQPAWNLRKCVFFFHNAPSFITLHLQHTENNFLRWNMGYGGVALYRKITCLPIFPLTFIIFFPAQSHGEKLLFYLSQPFQEGEASCISGCHFDGHRSIKLLVVLGLDLTGALLFT